MIKNTTSHIQYRASTPDFGRVLLARTRIDGKFHSTFMNIAYDSPHIYEYLGIILYCIQEGSERTPTTHNWHKSMFAGSSVELSEICDMLLL